LRRAEREAPILQGGDESGALYWIASTYKRQDMKSSTFDVKGRRRRITVFKVSKLWVFTQFFENKEVFKALLGYYHPDDYRFEINTIADRNNALKALERNGVDYELVEVLQGYVVKLPKFAKYAQILKNSIAKIKTASERIFLMKDLAAVEVAVSLGAEKIERKSSLLIRWQISLSASG
jgi:hypothetical protein